MAKLRPVAYLGAPSYEVILEQPLHRLSLLGKVLADATHN